MLIADRSASIFIKRKINLPRKKDIKLIKMQSSSLLNIITVIIFIHLNSVSTFWLTDTTLFEAKTPIQVSAPPIVIKTAEGESERAFARPIDDGGEVLFKNDWLRVEPTKEVQQVSYVSI